MVTVNHPEPYLKAIEVLVDEGRYPNRSEAIRTAVREFIKEEFSQIWIKKEKVKDNKVIKKSQDSIQELNDTEASTREFKTF